MMPLHQQQTGSQPKGGLMPSGPAYHGQVQARQRRGRIWAVIFQAAMVSGIIALCALLFNIVNQSFGQQH